MFLLMCLIRLADKIKVLFYFTDDKIRERKLDFSSAISLQLPKLAPCCGYLKNLLTVKILLSSAI